MLNDYSIARMHLSGDVAMGDYATGLAQQILKRLLHRMKLGGVTVGRDEVKLGDGTTIVARVNGPVNNIYVDAPYKAQQQEKTVTVQLSWSAPDFISGVVVNNTYLREAGRVFYPTAMTAKPRHDLKPWQPTQLPRLDVQNPPHTRAYEVDARFSPNVPYSEVYSNLYRRVRPTMFSGTMRKVVQFIMGYGKTGWWPLANDYKSKTIYNPTFEKKNVPQDEAHRVKSDGKSSTKLFGHFPAHRQRYSQKGVPVYYDNNFYRTHGITTADDGRLWLVEISRERGVWAMPLPMVGSTDTNTFRQSLEHVKYTAHEGGEAKHETYRDEQALTVLDELGGFPFSIGMPEAQADVIECQNAGLLIQLAQPEELDGFYQTEPQPYDFFGWRSYMPESNPLIGHSDCGGTPTRT